MCVCQPRLCLIFGSMRHSSGTALVSSQPPSLRCGSPCPEARCFPAWLHGGLVSGRQALWISPEWMFWVLLHSYTFETCSGLESSYLEKPGLLWVLFLRFLEKEYTDIWSWANYFTVLKESLSVFFLGSCKL